MFDEHEGKSILKSLFRHQIYLSLSHAERFLFFFPGQRFIIWYFERFSPILSRLNESKYVFPVKDEPNHTLSPLEAK